MKILNIVKWIVPVFALALVLSGVPGHAQTHYGAGPGCSAIEGILATDLTNVDMFIGRINLGQLRTSGGNHKGKGNFGNSDSDALSDSLEECINDALIGYCGTIGGDDNTAYSFELWDCGSAGLTQRGNQACFKITFEEEAWSGRHDGGKCAISECSDHVDNDGSCRADFGGAIGLPPDDGCADYDDDDESGGTNSCA